MSIEEVVNRLRATGCPEGAIYVVLQNPDLISRFALLCALQDAREAMYEELTGDELQAIDDLASAVLKKYNRLYNERVDIIEQRTFN